MTTTHVVHGENLRVMRVMPSRCVDLCLCSPPYEDARFYGEHHEPLVGEAWVAWALPRLRQTVRLSAGLSMWVVEGTTNEGAYSATPQKLLVAAIADAEIVARKPIVYRRWGVPGSGGKQYLRNVWEHVLVVQRAGRRGSALELPYANPTATGKPPKFPPGGATSHRNQKGDRKAKKAYQPPAIANPGNIIDCGAGGHIGSRIANEGAAPFPAKLAHDLILPFSPPGGIVLDCFGGTGTTAVVANQHGRHAILIENNEADVERSIRRLKKEAGVEAKVWDGRTDESAVAFWMFMRRWVAERNRLRGDT